MDIKEEIKRIQEQLDALKKKQEESEKEKFTLQSGQIYSKGNSDYYDAFISSVSFNQKTIWSYAFSDGSGKAFNTKQELLDYLDKDGFRYSGKLKSFTKE